MKRVIVIPARYGSTRLPGKPLREAGGKTLIRWVYDAALSSRLADETLVATDDHRIRDAVRAFGGIAVMTSPDCASGTDRVYEAVKDRGASFVVNLQGDEPGVRGDMIDALFSALEGDDTPMATLCTPIRDEKACLDPNTVKVVMDRWGFALYFSRSPIPFVRNPGVADAQTYAHVGVYGFSMAFLHRFVSLDRGTLEQTESLEQLRVLEHGYRIRVIPVAYEGFGIDTEEDLARFARTGAAEPDR